MCAQITLDGYLNEELICCKLSENFYWIRIPEGKVPERFKKRVHFCLYGFHYLYEPTKGKEEIIKAFSGEVTEVSWKEGFSSGI